MINDAFEQFIRGSVIFWLIMLVSCLMWYLIGTAFFKQWQYRKELTASYSSLWAKLQKNKRANESSRGCLVNLFSQYMYSHQMMINTLAKILPLLGLLGTVNGMITTFQSMTAEVGSYLSFSVGIASALLTTLAGLVTSLSGVFFHHRLKQRAQKFTLTFSQQLSRV
ncbi:MotA/TolQ/ExbB proton channel family protein [uncultured Photobacterium sp.]|uniref:MotA/TolQ/ExbB proton channel family protein n=1 Tax=uncultured Photobacterium sp. TaxID=173973 RepID=UPI0026069B21|nr:MotA/TolQ/ExbB proton channel family protein [uncultured Photobacterium sp.]